MLEDTISIHIYISDIGLLNKGELFNMVSKLSCHVICKENKYEVLT